MSNQFGHTNPFQSSDNNQSYNEPREFGNQIFREIEQDLKELTRDFAQLGRGLSGDSGSRSLPGANFDRGSGGDITVIVFESHDSYSRPRADEPMYGFEPIDLLRGGDHNRDVESPRYGFEPIDLLRGGDHNIDIRPGRQDNMMDWLNPGGTPFEIKPWPDFTPFPGSNGRGFRGTSNDGGWFIPSLGDVSNNSQNPGNFILADLDNVLQRLPKLGHGLPGIGNGMPNPGDILDNLPKPGQGLPDIGNGLPDLTRGLPNPGDIVKNLPKPPKIDLPGLGGLPSPSDIFGDLF